MCNAGWGDFGQGFMGWGGWGGWGAVFCVEAAVRGGWGDGWAMVGAYAGCAFGGTQHRVPATPLGAARGGRAGILPAAGGAHGLREGAEFAHGTVRWCGLQCAGSCSRQQGGSGQHAQHQLHDE